MDKINKKLEKHKKSPKKRSLTRLIAIQVAYQFCFFDEKKDLAAVKNDVIQNYVIDADDNISSYEDKIDEEFLDNLLYSLEVKDKIIEEIQPFLKEGFSFERLDDVLQQILSFATFELKFMKDTPFKVVIDEYVDITASFFEEKKITFINGILENMAKKFRSQDFEKEGDKND